MVSKVKAAVEAPPKPKKIISAEQTAKYIRHKVKTAGGQRRAVDNGDRISKLLRGKSLAEVGQICHINGLGDRFNGKWSKLNPGMARMAAGNALRHLIANKHKLVLPVSPSA